MNRENFRLFEVGTAPVNVTYRVQQISYDVRTLGKKKIGIFGGIK
jgi:hypothetical protein